MKSNIVPSLDSSCFLFLAQNNGKGDAAGNSFFDSVPLYLVVVVYVTLFSMVITNKYNSERLNQSCVPTVLC